MIVKGSNNPQVSRPKKIIAKAKTMNELRKEMARQINYVVASEIKYFEYDHHPYQVLMIVKSAKEVRAKHDCKS